MSLKPNALVNLSLAKEYLDIPSIDNSVNAKVERLINVATSQIESYCDRSFITKTFIEFYDGRRSNQILLKNWPCESISEIRVDNSSLFPITSILDPNTYNVVNKTIIQFNYYKAPLGYRNIKVTYDAGYGVIGTIPSDLEEACLSLVMLHYMKRNDRRVGIESKNKNNESIKYTQGLPKDIQEMIDQYRRLDFGEGDVGIQNG